MAENSLNRQSSIDGTLINRARELIVAHQDATVSFLQRRLRLGYRLALAVQASLEGDVLSAPRQDGSRELLTQSFDQGLDDEPRFPKESQA